MANRPLYGVVLAAVFCQVISAMDVNSSQTVKLPAKDLFKCKDGIIVPMWLPASDISVADRAARATVYFLVLAYLFLGVSIISDRFMSAIEVITSQEKVVVVKRHNSEPVKVNVRIWNETVSNLTLMALGSSAPEILLSIIEVIGNKFNSGDLGPGTIVGSAAYNLFIITAICVHVVPSSKAKKIKHLRVFFVTSAWSIFAYVWLYIIIAVISPGEVEIWEGALTFIFFPVTVLTAWIADRKWLPKFVTRGYRSGHKGVVVLTEGITDLEMDADSPDTPEDDDDEMALFEKHRKEYIDIIRELHKKHPNMEADKLEAMAEYEIMNRGPKSRAFYRIQATRKLTGGGNVIKKKLEKDIKKQKAIEPIDNLVTKVFFEPAHYTVMENVGSFLVTVKRAGGTTNSTVCVDYKTEDGTATAGSDYENTEGTLVFRPGETEKNFSVTIIDDDVFEEDEHFSVRLSNLRRSTPSGIINAGGPLGMDLVLGTPPVATVMILDDDHSGIFHFEASDREVAESAGDIHIKVIRSSGARGTVTIPYKTIDGTAKAGRDFQSVFGELCFTNNEHEKYIVIKIINEEEYEKTCLFYLELGEPKLVTTASDMSQEGVDVSSLTAPDPNSMGEDDRIAELGKPRLGEQDRIRITIIESKEFKKTVDKLLAQKRSFIVGTSSWREQFAEAFTVNADEDENADNDGDNESQIILKDKMPSCGDYICHYLALFWKVLFAFVPPTDYLSGWVCFVVSIGLIGILTAVIGDIASHIGCTIGLMDVVTAVSFIAMGTSLPDTFASKVAAIGDQYADGAIGNVTGSNAVNIFLGIGIAWTIAAIAKAVNGEKFRVESGSLGFSVTMFCIMAVAAIAVILMRRHKSIGGELGGPMKFKIPTAIFLFCLWFLYIVISGFEAYGYIKGF